MSKLLKKTRWIHKYFGLALLLFLAWMSISGVLLNHPKLIQEYSVANFLVPKNYIPQNWNRSTLKNILYTKTTKTDSILLYGNSGVFIAQKDGTSVEKYMQGDFPKESRIKRTNHLWEDTTNNKIFAATNGGLFVCKKNENKWYKIDLPNLKSGIVKILSLDIVLVIVSNSAFYTAKYSNCLNFKKKIPQKEKAKEETVSLVKLFFALHDGSIFGITGKIIWDIAGLIMFFLCVSAFYIWYYPKKWKRKYKRKKNIANEKEKSKYNILFKYHKKLGWYFFILLVIIVFTGMCLRPPLIMAIFKGKINKKWYPSIENANPWHNKIKNAFYDSSSDRIIVYANDGIWAGNLEKNTTFEKLKISVPIFAMGATVFDEGSKGNWLIGSFGGIFRYNVQENKSESLLNVPKAKRKGMPGSVLVTGYVKAPDNNYYVLGHYKGLCYLTGKPNTEIIKMPDSIAENHKMPLWNFLFELHNGRIFKGVLGGFYILIIPLGGLLSLFILLSGIYDYLKNKKRKTNKLNTNT